MPCALTEPGNYPHYIKSILTAINAGNDDELKACACSLRSPVNNDGCLIADSSNKIGAFPFCFGDGIPPDPEQYIKTNLETMMKIYWYRKWKIASSGFLAIAAECHLVPTSPVDTNKTIIFTNKELVCNNKDFFWVESGEPYYWSYDIAFTNFYLNDKDFYFNFYVMAQDGWFFTAPDGSCDGYGCECGTFKVKLEGITLGIQKMCRTTDGCPPPHPNCSPGSLSIELNIESSNV